MGGATSQGFDQEAFERIFLGEAESDHPALTAEGPGQSQQDLNHLIADEVPEQSEVSEQNREGANLIGQSQDRAQVEVGCELSVRDSSKTSATKPEVEPNAGNLIQNLKM